MTKIKGESLSLKARLAKKFPNGFRKKKKARK
jgi:hypothetical protein